VVWRKARDSFFEIDIMCAEVGESLRRNHWFDPLQSIVQRGWAQKSGKIEQSISCQIRLA
jgi:hypothetical protein